MLESYNARRDTLYHLSIVSCAIGVFILFSGMALLPTSKIYRGLLYLFLYFLPLYAAIRTPRFFIELIKQNKIFFVLIGYAFIHTLVVSSSEIDSSHIKVFFYIPLLLAVLTLLHRYYSDYLIRAFLLAAIAVAIMAAFNIIYFYGIEEAAPYSRITPLGMMSNPVLASYIFGISAVGTFAYLMRSQVGLKFQIVLLLSVLANSAYVYLSGSRAPIIAMLLAYFIAMFSSTYRYKYVFIIVASLIAVGVIAYRWDMLLERGTSSRPELALLGIQKALDAFWFGYGIRTDHNFVTASGIGYRHPHNQFVEIFLNLGIVGVVLWLLVISAPLQRLVQRGVSVSYMMGISMLIFAVLSSLVDGDSPFERIQEIWFICWIPLCWLLASNGIGLQLNQVQGQVQIQPDKTDGPGYAIIENCFGQRMFINPADAIGRRILKYSIYGAEVTTLMTKLLSNIKNPIALDIGANIGNHCLAMTTTSAKVVAFEPQTAVAKILRKNLILNNIDNCEVCEFGLSNKEDNITFYQNLDGNSGKSSFCRERRAENFDEHILPVKVGDEILHNQAIQAVDFIKIDAQGFEANVIEGLKKTITANQPIILMKWNCAKVRADFAARNIFNTVLKGYAIHAIGSTYDKPRHTSEPLASLTRRFHRMIGRRTYRFEPFDPAESYRNIILYPPGKKKLLGIQ